MPILAAAVALLGMLALVALLIPVSLVMRYRGGTTRRMARGWIVTINVVACAASSALFLIAAAITNTWVPQAFSYALMGLAAGCVLGLLGIAATRWEITTTGLYYTPNRWLVLSMTLVVMSRLAYGFWRGWQAWRVAPDQTAWFATAGVAGSLAAGAVVLGYYLTYWFVVRRRLQQRMRRYPRRF